MNQRCGVCEYPINQSDSIGKTLGCDQCDGEFCSAGCATAHEQEHEQPDQCYGCGRYAGEGEVFTKTAIDADPGDPEVGPRPDIIEAGFCRECLGNLP